MGVVLKKENGSLFVIDNFLTIDLFKTTKWFQI